MGHDFDKKTKKMLLDALARAQADGERMREKRELQVWKEINVTSKLVDLLSTFTKDELDDIRKNLEFTGISSLKKAEMIDELAKRIPANFIKVLSLLDLDRYQLLKKAAKNFGVTNAPENFSTDNAKLLTAYSIIFPGTYQNQKVLVMPQELVELFTEIDSFELQKIVHRNDEWIRLTHGMLYFYGVLNTSVLIKKLTDMTNQEIAWKEYFDVMTFACKYYGQVKFNSHGFSDRRVIDVEKLKEEHKMRETISYYPFTKNQLLKASEPLYVDHTPEMKDLIRFILENYDVPKNVMDDITYQIISLINLEGNTSMLMEFLQSRFEIPTFEMVEELAEKLIALHNHTRMWILKGYSPNELSELRRKQLNPVPEAAKMIPQTKANVVDINSRKKIGRNDPCPCGSGKKHKKCCGK